MAHGPLVSFDDYNVIKFGIIYYFQAFCQEERKYLNKPCESKYKKISCKCDIRTN